jgi:sugar phosphate permease
MMRRGQIVVMVTLVVGYASFYLCRANVDAALPLFKQAYGYDEDQLGILASASVAAYAIGKLVLGALGDWLGGRRLILLSIGGSVAASLALGASSGLWAFVGFAVVNRFFQAGGWAGLVHVVSRWFPPEKNGSVMGVMSTSYDAGNIAALGLSSALVGAGLGWRSLFRVNPLIFLAVGVVLAFTLRGEPPIKDEPRPSGSAKPPPPEQRDTFRTSFPWLAKKPAFWGAVILSMLLTFVRNTFMTWSPMYLAHVAEQTGGSSPIASGIAKSAFFSVAGIIAALSIGRLSDRFGPGRRAPLMVGSLAVLVVAVLVLAHAPVRDAWFAAGLIAACGLFLLGPYSLLAGALCLDVAGKRGTATAAGIIDGTGYLSASLVGIVIGRVAKRWGWSTAFDVVAAASTAALLVALGWVLLGRRARAERAVEGAG